MKIEYRFRYITITTIIKTTTFTMVILMNILVTLWIENKLSLERSLMLNIFIISLILEITEIILVIISLILLVRLQGINRYYKGAITIPTSIELIIYTYHLVRFFGFLCFAPGILLINIPFVIISLIGVLVLQRNQK